MGRQKKSTYSIFLKVKADYADTSYWTTDGHPSRGIDIARRRFEKVKPTVADFLTRTLATIAKVAKTEPVEYSVTGLLNASYPDGRQANRFLDIKAGSAEQVQQMARAWTDKSLNELALIGAGDTPAGTLREEKGKSSIVQLFIENRKRTGP